jgi:hypothetical protein
MPRSKTVMTIALATGLLAATMAFAACGGGGDSKKTPTTAPAKTEASGGKSTPAAGKTASDATAAPTKSSSSSGSGGDTDDLKAIAEKFANSTFTADYKVTGATASDGFTNGTMKIIKKGKDKFRFEITGTQDGQDVSVIFIETPDLSAYCLKNAGELGALLGVADGEGVCFKSEDETTNPVGSLSDSLKDFENQDVTVLDTSDRTIAGEDGTCYKVQDNETQEITTSCFNDDGAMLFSETEGDDSGAIEATSVDSSVSDSDFDAPYEVKDAPGLLGGNDTP